jgi:hypothetical protein
LHAITTTTTAATITNKTGTEDKTKTEDIEMNIWGNVEGKVELNQTYCVHIDY